MRDHRERMALAKREDDATGRSDFGHTAGIYFIQSGAFIKIGQSINVCARYRGIQNANPKAVTPLAFIHVPTPIGMQAKEEELHALFAPLRERGEWFRDDPSIRQWIEANAAKWPAERPWLAM
jgi:hypothetical protein